MEEFSVLKSSEQKCPGLGHTWEGKCDLEESAVFFYKCVAMDLVVFSYRKVARERGWSWPPTAL